MTTIHGDLLWCDGGWPGSCHEQELLALSGIDQVLDAAEVVTLVDRGFGAGQAAAVRRWRGLLVRVRDVFRAVAALISLGR